jgi:hypothetical protein
MTTPTPIRRSRPGAMRDASRTTSPADRNECAVLTVDEFCLEIKVSKDTFYHSRKVGTAPARLRLPNGALRIDRADMNTWLAALRDAG